MRYLLDTHAWLWARLDPGRLSPHVRRTISEPEADDELLLSIISVWELCMLQSKHRITINGDLGLWIDRALSIPQMRLVPLSPAIVCDATRLPGTFHGDPADQIIVATARDRDAALLTKDTRIRRYRHARTIW